jgi:hypothetical protein
MRLKDRKNPRALIHFPAEFFIDDKKTECMVVDISLSGLRINFSSEKKLPKNFEILVFVLPDIPPLQTSVKKIWRNKLQAGLEFIDLGNKEKKVFDALIKIHRAENLSLDI